ncbi:hypothetical protein NX02_17270 [Sphingomonas sanxanigenens DSM 19645 = NX02]|uniref:Uncharacterized protein n=1 Tax=Sphingomonas sanxanigenens DSM 19645 = NX02 TaxID=1123269 RepID=W0AF27_9SPHN|nr:hypothetical protein NX02_17270 [Sphingomonas sanxanigenens DSM 19645 = NX02]
MMVLISVFGSVNKIIRIIIPVIEQAICPE